MTKLDRSQLLRELKAAFPELTAQLNAQQGLPHLEVDALRRFAQRAIFEGERDVAARCFSIAARYLCDGNAATRKAIDVSFVEPLEFESPAAKHRWAWEALPAPLKKAYVDFHGKAAF